MELHMDLLLLWIRNWIINWWILISLHLERLLVKYTQRARKEERSRKRQKVEIPRDLYLTL